MEEASVDNHVISLTHSLPCCLLLYILGSVILLYIIHKLSGKNSSCSCFTLHISPHAVPFITHKVVGLSFHHRHSLWKVCSPVCAVCVV